MYDYSYFGCFVYHLHIKKEKKIKKKNYRRKGHTISLSRHYDHHKNKI